LIVEVWDYDDLVPEDLIGETVIDLEDRFFSKKYRKLPLQPIETRDIFSPDSKLSRGKIRLWVDMFPINELKLFPVIDIKHKPERVTYIIYIFIIIIYIY